MARQKPIYADHCRCGIKGAGYYDRDARGRVSSRRGSLCTGAELTQRPACPPQARPRGEGRGKEDAELAHFTVPELQPERDLARARPAARSLRTLGPSPGCGSACESLRSEKEGE